MAFKHKKNGPVSRPAEPRKKSPPSRKRGSRQDSAYYRLCVHILAYKMQLIDRLDDRNLLSSWLLIANNQHRNFLVGYCF